MGFTTGVAVITGASSGIGRALAVALTRRGMRVGVTARRADRLESLVAEVRASGGTIEAIACDVTQRDDTLAAIHALAEKLGPVDLMIANAGRGETAGADPMNIPLFEEMVKVNLLGVAYAFEAVMASMLARQSGHLVAISSLAAYKGLPGSAGYCATKAAVNTYCEGLRIELNRRGVAVTCVCPGFVRTEMTAGKPHPMPFVMDADQAAERILGALAHRPKVYNFPRRTKWLMNLTHWLPDWLIAKKLQHKEPPTELPTESSTKPE